MTGSFCCVGMRGCVAGIKGDYPSPHPLIRIPKHLHNAIPEGSHGILAALCRCTLSQTPTRHRRFVENKSQTAIRKACRQPVEALFRPVMEPVLSDLPIALCFSPVFKDHLYACTLRRRRILADLIGQIKSKTGKMGDYDRTHVMRLGQTSRLELCLCNS
jgi:hypothetical protein